MNNVDGFFKAGTTLTLTGHHVERHICSGIDCELCAKADQEAAHSKLETWRAARSTRKINPRKRVSVVEDAQPMTPSPVVASVPLSNYNDPARLDGIERTREFILAGNAYFTIRSKKTGTRYTYRVSRAKCSRCGSEKCCKCWAYPNYFVSVLTDSDNTADYTYLGMIGDLQAFKATRASLAANRQEWPSFKAFEWTWSRMNATHAVPTTVEIWHEGRCGRCGRKLTVPESIASGIGPVCEEM